MRNAQDTLRQLRSDYRVHRATMAASMTDLDHNGYANDERAFIAGVVVTDDGLEGIAARLAAMPFLHPELRRQIEHITDQIRASLAGHYELHDNIAHNRRAYRGALVNLGLSRGAAVARS